MNKIKLILIFTMIVGISACKKNDSNNAGTAEYSVRMTDAPGPYSEVNVDIIGVEITGNGGATTMLNINPGIYNLLEFANGADTLIATGSLEAGDVQQIRLILGVNNTVVIDSVSYPLATPSADQSGLKIQVHQTLEAGVAYSILLDFDANQSIVKTGNGAYKLKPVIRAVDSAVSGSIKGQVLPLNAGAAITATYNGVSYSSVTDANGYFIIKGLPPGTYDVKITPAAPFVEVTQTNIIVNVGVTTNIGIVNL